MFVFEDFSNIACLGCSETVAVGDGILNAWCVIACSVTVEEEVVFGSDTLIIVQTVKVFVQNLTCLGNRRSWLCSEVL